MKAKSKLVSIIVSAVAFVVVLALNIAIFATPLGGLLDKFVVGYKNGGSDSAARAEGAALAEQIQGEGTVLVKNATESGETLLPISKADVPKVNVFGWSATDWVISGSGSGQVKNSETIKGVEYPIDLLDALTESGIEYNTEITNMYEKFYGNREFSENGGGINGAQANAGSLKAFNYEFSRLYEPHIDDKNFYTESMLSNAKEYSDTAIVAIGRVSGESNDSPKVQYKRAVKGGNPVVDNTRTYLEISTEEEALLQYVGANYENVIVLINSTNVMELGFVETIEGLDACLIVATTGSTGARAIPKLIYNDLVDAEGNSLSITPSGKTVDTYAYDLSTSPTYVDTGSGNDSTNFYTNGNGLYPTTTTHTNGSSNEPYRGVAYTDYRENIYVGYKWYETADADGFWNSDFAKDKWGIENGYEDVVQYPFGHGLSYTDFTWKITYLEQPNGSTLTPDDIIKVGVQVTNVGEYPGQDVVQLYYGTEYTSSGIEKSAVNLAAFAKTTQVIQPNESAYVELELTVSDMASYDAYEVKVPGGGYILEEGEYYLSLRTDAHTLAGTKVVGGDKSVYNKDTLVYNVSKDTRCLEEASNRFTGENTTDGVAIDGNSDGTASITYLSRTNFAETFPAEKSANREMHDSIKALNLYTRAMATAWGEEHADAEPVTFGDSTQGEVVYENGQINEKGIELGLDYDHEDWDAVLNRITRNEMLELVLHGYTQTLAVKSIGKPETLDLDGPNQIGSFSGGINGKTGFSSIVLAQSWNLELAYSMGLTFGSECIDASVTGWYGPGVNIHRSPFGGRNYEYYSEDALISGLMCAKTVAAAKNRGVFCYLKHICLYETESGRDGMYTWVTEQALREIYIRPFELAVKKGGSTAMMTSYGRIGAVWTGGSSALLNEVVRGEWGFKGAFLTDYADHQEFMNGDHMIRNGGDLWMDGYLDNGKFNYDDKSNAFNQALRGATKNIVYMWLNALATNADYNDKIEQGIIQDSIVIPTSPELNFRWYIPVVIALDVIVVAGCGCWLFLTLRKKEM